LGIFKLRERERERERARENERGREREKEENNDRNFNYGKCHRSEFVRRTIVYVLWVMADDERRSSTDVKLIR